VIFVRQAVDHHTSVEFSDFIAMHLKIHDEVACRQLEDNLVEHLWVLKENQA
jgi:hypothetical protein